MLDFINRGRRSTKNDFDHMAWRSRCNRYMVVESLFRLTWINKDGKREGLPVVYYAEVRDGKGWSLISRHRKRARAEEACQRHARRV